MKIWFVSHYAMPPQYEIREKTQKFAHYLSDQGYDVTLVTASTVHGTSINLIEDRKSFIEKEYDGLKYIHIRCSSYEGNGISRVKNMLEFGWQLPKIFHNFEKPDLIVATVNCINYSSVAKICQKYNMKFIVDVRDLWPLSIVEFLHYSPNNPIIRYLYYREKDMYQKADEIIFSMEGGHQYLIDKGWDNVIENKKVHHINNGVDLSSFAKAKNENIFNNSLLNDTEKFKVIYTGSIRTGNSLELLLEAAKIVKIKEPEIQFLLFGDGEHRQQLENHCKTEQISNVHFYGRVEKKMIPSILSQGDCNVLNYHNAGTWKYGGSQNKLFEYLASGKPIISNVKIAYSLIEQHSCGMIARDDTAESYADTICSMYKIRGTREYNDMCENAMMVALEYDYPNLAKKLVNLIKRYE